MKINLIRAEEILTKYSMDKMKDKILEIDPDGIEAAYDVIMENASSANQKITELSGLLFEIVQQIRNLED